MLNDILDTVQAENASKENVNNKTFNLYKCIDDLVKLEKPTAIIKKIELLIDIESETPAYIISDQKKIHRILLNLISNAVKFTKTGFVTIGVKRIEEKNNKIHLQFSVADTGIGISKELQDKVFERFFRVTPSYKGIYRGHGLGLNIVQSYVALLDGQVTLTSKEGIGTTFFFDIWCEKVSEKSVHLKQSEDKKNDFKQQFDISFIKSTRDKASKPSFKDCTDALKILLIEDNAGALKVLTYHVEKLGYNTEVAVTGEEAFDLVCSKYFDLIISDVGLPGISGIEMTSKIRLWEKKHNQLPTPIVGLTGHADQETQLKCLSAGMNSVITKPANQETIEAAINQFAVKKNINEPLKTTIGLGFDLPNMEKDLFDLENYPLLDAKIAINQLGDSNIFIEMLNDFIAIEKGQEDIFALQRAYENKNWFLIEQIAHKIKGGALYISTVRMRYACQYLERYIKVGRDKQRELLYFQLLKVNKQTIKEITTWLSSY